MAFRDFIKIGSRVVGAGVGGYFGGAPGAMAGYGLGATVGDLAGGAAPVKNVSVANIADYTPDMAYAKHPDRVTTSTVEQTQYGISDKIDAVADPIVAAGASAYGSFGGKKIFGSKKTTPLSTTPSGYKPFSKSLSVGGVQAQDLGGVSTSLDETNNMIDATGQLFGNINANRLSANLKPLGTDINAIELPEISNAGSLPSTTGQFLANKKNLASGILPLRNTTYGVIGQ